MRRPAYGGEQLQVEAEYVTGQACGESGRTVETLPVGLAQMEIEGFPGWVPVLVMFGREDARPLLGAHALEAFRLTVDPVTQTLRRVRAILA